MQNKYLRQIGQISYDFTVEWVGRAVKHQFINCFEVYKY